MTKRVGLPAFILTVLLLGHAVYTGAAELPQTHAYQKELRAYLATLQEQDFGIPLKPVTLSEAAFEDTDDAARYWMLFLERAPDVPGSEGLRVHPRHFTLSAIEAGPDVNMSVGRSQWFDPKDVAWWTRWDYPGNPYKDSKPAKLRAFVASAVDLMMQDQEHEDGKNKRSDYLGGSMIRFGYTYYAVKDALPPKAGQAYKAGLVRMFEKLELWTPRGSGGSDMEFFQLVGMWYAAQALGDPYPERAKRRAHVVIERVVSPTGYEKHGNAFDVSYQGIALRFLAWAAMLYEDPTIDAALHRMLVLKSHLTLPEPDDTLAGPTHFNTGTSADAPHDQWAWPSRDLAMSMVDDEALYTVWARLELPDVAAMKERVAAQVVKLVPATPLDKAPGPWKETHWVNTLNFAHDHYRAGFYQRLNQLAQANSPLTRSPFDRDADFITDLNGGGEFLAARIRNVGVILHTGRLAENWANGVSGKSGGGLSAFWMPGRGTVILGRCRATQSETPDEWTDANGRGPYTWAVHAITGRGANGHYFSTARLLTVDSEQRVNGTTEAVGTITEELSSSKWADPEDELKGRVVYRREYRINKDGAAFKSGLTTDGTDRFQELWELIPIHMGYPERRSPVVTEVMLRSNGGEWKPAGESPAEADQVRLTRYGQHAYIVFDEPHHMKLSPEVNAREFSRESVRNLMVDVLDKDGAPKTLVYRVTPELQ